MKQDQHETSTHLSQETLAQLKSGRLTNVEMIEALEHLANCSLCAERFAESFQQQELLPVPVEFSSKVLKEMHADHIFKESRSIMKTTQRLTVEKPNRAKANPMTQESVMFRSNRKREFYYYAARVSLAMCMTLMLLFSGTFNFMVNTVEAKATQTIDFSKVNAFTENIRNISDKIVDMEVYNNDQKKK
jgi:hypothetical protein